MTIRSLLALALLAGITGVLIGRIPVSRDAPRPQVKAPHAAFTAPLAGRECKVERAKLAATKTQLALCTAGAPQPLGPDAPTAFEEEAEAEVNRVRRNIEVLRKHPDDAVWVRRTDHTLSVYPPNEPIPDGIIVARELPGGGIAYYAGPDAGPRSDPAAFRPLPGPPGSGPVWGRLPDGTITMDGKPVARPRLNMIGGNYDEDAEE